MDFNLDTATEQLSTTPAVLTALLIDRSAPWVDGDEGPGTWSPYQVLGHLTHIEERDWIDRIRVGTGKQAPRKNRGVGRLGQKAALEHTDKKQHPDILLAARSLRQTGLGGFQGNLLRAERHLRS